MGQDIVADEKISVGSMTGSSIVTGHVVGNISSSGSSSGSGERQSLAKAALEIQDLLKQLEQTNPTATEPEKAAYVSDETSPTPVPAED